MPGLEALAPAKLMKNISRYGLCVLLTLFVAPAAFGQQSLATDTTSEPVAPQGTPLPFLSVPDRERAVVGHVAQEDIDAGRWSLTQLREAGLRLFVARFTRKDGAGRPASTGARYPTRRSADNDVGFLRSAGPDANSCASCHHSPMVGGAGDFVANVFTAMGERDPADASIEPQFGNERVTPELNGTAAIELLAREMTRDLQHLRRAAVKQVQQNKQPVRVELTTKGVSFGAMTIHADGSEDLSEVEGVDHDLVIRPFGQKGTIVSLRDFTITAANLHHGMQAAERFGMRFTGDADFDGDGTLDELTVGDITALVTFQAMLNVPGRVLPADETSRENAARGEQLFHQVKCTSCHVSELPLNDPTFTEPGPFNSEITLSVEEVDAPLKINLETHIAAPSLARNSEGQLVVRAFTDLKRHKIADQDRPYFRNEIVLEQSLPTDVFLTRRLWAVRNTGPYGHRGDILSIEEAIHHHGGEAAESRSLFEQLSSDEQQMVVTFLRTLQIVPEGTSAVQIEPRVEPLPYTPREE